MYLQRAGRRHDGEGERVRRHGQLLLGQHRRSAWGALKEHQAAQLQAVIWMLPEGQQRSLCKAAALLEQGCILSPWACAGLPRRRSVRRSARSWVPPESLHRSGCRLHHGATRHRGSAQRWSACHRRCGVPPSVPAGGRPLRCSAERPAAPPPATVEGEASLGAPCRCAGWKGPTAAAAPADFESFQACR